MNKNIYFVLILMISAIAGILSSLAYPQYIVAQETQYGNDSQYNIESQYGSESQSFDKNESNICESCHNDPQDLKPHVNGGNFCLDCHGGKVHDYHKGPDAVSVDCITCHGFPPIIPQVNKTDGTGSIIVCDTCHAPPPDSYKSSNGNLILIHQSRSTYCINCHGTEIGETHKKILEK